MLADSQCAILELVSFCCRTPSATQYVKQTPWRFFFQLPTARPNYFSNLPPVTPCKYLKWRCDARDLIMVFTGGTGKKSQPVRVGFLRFGGGGGGISTQCSAEPRPFVRERAKLFALSLTSLTPRPRCANLKSCS